MVVGDINKISLSSSSFERMITEGKLYVDKTRMIENFLNSGSEVHLIARQRRLGKSLNMDMLMCFLTDKADFRHLFKGLYIESSPVWGMAHSAPVFYFDFKLMIASNFKQILYGMICDYIDEYCTDAKLSRLTTAYLNNNDFNNPNGLFYLTEAVYKATGKRSYILIDEYDKLLMDNYDSNEYDDLKGFETAVLSAGLKGNRYLEKALLTGVMRISHESMLSGLNNIVTFDVFNDMVYTDDYGFTENEIKCLNALSDFDTDEMRTWYNGIRIGNRAIYNTYSVASYLFHGEYGCFWGKSGTMHLVADLLNDGRRAILAKLLNGEQINISIASRISLLELSTKSSDHAFYSLLVQAGYLALCEPISEKDSSARVSIPNTELKIVWKQFMEKYVGLNADN